MSKSLNGKKVAILVADNFEQVEMTEPRKALLDAGATVHIVSPVSGQVKGVHHDKPGDKFDVDKQLKGAKPEEYDALMLPGGLMSPDSLRMDKGAVEFVKAFFTARKPVAAICHGPWLLAEAGVAKGRKLTSWPAIQTDMKNAGAQWTDEEVVTDNGLVTSRKPDDIPAFNKKMIEEFAEGIHEANKAA
jgi:protease I